MTDINLPDVLAEVSAAFMRYEKALTSNDVAVLDELFWNSPHTIRLSVREHGYGFDAIHAHRLAAAAGAGGIKQGRVRLDILTLGHDFATVNLTFKVRDAALIGRQSQAWARLPGLGWIVVSAHVSTVDASTLAPD